jgi:ATP-binding cassette, subfamily G (WHITE), member 2, SNQ2
MLNNPGSGCTTFLKILANQHDTIRDAQGGVHRDFHSPKEIATYERGNVQYFPEDDVHFTTLTVRGTIRFAAKTIPHTRADCQTRDEIIEEITDILITAFGIRHAQKTLVRDTSIRGVRSKPRFLRS